jgi:hypothetical protein
MSEIKTKPSSSSYREGWNKAFLKTGEEWAHYFKNQFIILDTNGAWDDETRFNETKITRSEFLQRVNRARIILKTQIK